MKKYGILLLMMILLLPFSVNAEEKIVNDYKYTIKNNSYKDYVCDKLEGKDYAFFTYFDNEKVVLSLLNEAPAYDYLIDFSKTDNCIPMTDEEVQEFNKNDYRYSYFWDKDNVIKKVKWTYDDNRYYIPTKDTSVDNDKIYFTIIDGITPVEVKNPNNGDLANYYEAIYLKQSQTYNSGSFYYMDNYDGTVTEVGQIPEAIYNNGELYYTEIKDIKFEEVLKLENTNFIVPKEIGVFNTDYQYDKSDNLDIITVKDKTYLMFVEENLGDPMVFDLDGNLIDFGLEKIMSPSHFESTKKDLIVLTIGTKNSNTKLYVMDSSFNIIYEEKYNDNQIYYLTTIGNTDYFAIDYYNDYNKLKVLEITKDFDQTINEEVPKTFDGIGTSIFIGILSLVGLICTIIYLKKIKTN